MQLILQEMKKIWRPPVLIAVALLSGLFYYLFMSYFVSGFTGSHPVIEQVDIAAQWVTQYGPTLEPEERREADALLVAYNREADLWISRHPLFAENGIQSFAQLRTIDHQEDRSTLPDGRAVPDFPMLHDQLYSQKSGYIGFKVEALESLFAKYDLFDTEPRPEQLYQSGNTGYASSQESARLRTLLDGTQYRSLLPESVLYGSAEYAAWLLILIALSTCLLISPLLVRDRMQAVVPLQWSSAAGRRIFGYQLAAVMLSSFLLTTINLLLFCGLYASNGISVFRSCGLSSFIDFAHMWTDWTYGQYILILIGLAYLFSLGAAALVFLLSRFSGSYVAMLLKALPLFILLAIAGSSVMTRAFSFGNPLYKRFHLVGIEAAACVLLLLASLFLCALTAKHQRTADQ